MRFKLWPFLCLLLSIAAGCESFRGQEAGASTDSTRASGEGGASDETATAYRAFLTGAVTDTLRGNAWFGNVVNPETGKDQTVIKLQTGIEFTGGIFITRGDAEPLQAGRYSLADVSESQGAATDGAFVILYREGLSRKLASVSGNLLLETISDTLIQGSFEANLSGLISIGGRSPARGEVRARGEFSARAGTVGYIIGL